MENKEIKLLELLGNSLKELETRENRTDTIIQSIDKGIENIDDEQLARLLLDKKQLEEAIEI